MPFSFFSENNRIRRQAEKKLNEYNRPSMNYFVLIALSAAIATFGLALDNTSIVIGAMVVAPLITPVFAFSLGLILFRMKNVAKSFLSLFFGTLAGLCVSILMAMVVILINGNFALGSEVLGRTEPNLLFFLVAFLSGIAGAYAYGRPQVLESITGIAISVAIVPPLAVTGIGIALQNYHLMQTSFLLYAFNLLGIAFGSIVTFVALGFGKDIET
ncbi:TIGR00341 family protein [Candidatus Nomurabacteria bacterium]|nr:TIGR00341 family protein [Candidatus Nomurabacteria bacterium]